MTGRYLTIAVIGLLMIGGIGSVTGALVGAVLVGVTDTLGRVFLPMAFAQVMPPAEASGVGSALASVLIYVLMAIVLVWRPQGLFPAP